MMILAIDPGPEESAFVMFHDGKIFDMGFEKNGRLFEMLAERVNPGMDVVIERVASYGMAVGASVFETCFTTGRIIQFYIERDIPESRIHLLPRLDVKQHLCHDTRAKDANISRSLKDRFGEPGTKKNPGALYGIKSHLWAALAIAVTAMDRRDAGLPIVEVREKKPKKKKPVQSVAPGE